MIHPNVDREHYPIIESTQKLAKEGIQKLTGDCWKLYTANEQTGGRGQYDRRWVSPPDVNIYATYSFLIPAQSSYLLFHVPQVSTIAIAKTLEDFGFQPKIKWVNDLILNQKKMSGILCESQNISLDTYAVMIGIGVNVNMTAKQCSEVDQPVTSLFAETGKLYDKEAVLKSLTFHLYEEINRLLSRGFSSFQSELNQRLAFLHQTVKVKKEHPKEILEGVFEGIDDMGRMKLRKYSSELIVLQDGHIIRG